MKKCEELNKIRKIEKLLFQGFGKNYLATKRRNKQYAFLKRGLHDATFFLSNY